MILLTPLYHTHLPFVFPAGQYVNLMLVVGKVYVRAYVHQRLVLVDSVYYRPILIDHILRLSRLLHKYGDGGSFFGLRNLQLYMIYIVYK